MRSDTPQSEYAIETDHLTRRYGERLAVSDLSIRVPKGVVTGFVGANGAGKTTTIRMLLGLIKATTGTATVLGESIDEPEKYLSGVGALIEGPAVYPALSARKNLRVLTQLGNLPEERIAAVLETVGLADRADEPVKGFSLGMRQRLGLAMSLLPDPELLILDEPTNGLDPAGISEIRDLLSALAASGRSVFVSSHLLSEIEAICDHLVFINQGELVFEGSVQELIDQQHTTVVVAPEHPEDMNRLAAICDRLGYEVAMSKGGELVVSCSPHDAPDINRAAMDQAITLRELRLEKPTLEEVFLATTSPHSSHVEPEVIGVERNGHVSGIA